MHIHMRIYIAWIPKKALGFAVVCLMKDTCTFRVQLRCKDAGLVIFWNAVTGSEMARLSAHEDLWVRFVWFHQAKLPCGNGEGTTLK